MSDKTFNNTKETVPGSTSSNNQSVLDALVFSSINDNSGIDDSEYFSQTIKSIPGKYVYDSSAELQILKNIRNGILNNTNIKRACCLGQDNISVRIPIPNEIQKRIDDDEYKTANIELIKRFKYFDKNVYVPKKLCPQGYEPKTTYCDNFYSVYCKNILNEYNKVNRGRSYNHDEFIKFKPDCGCYGDVSSFGKQLPSTFPRKCIFNGCGESAPGYLDKDSRENDCSITMCNSMINLTNAQVGGDANIAPHIKQNCGKGKKETGDNNSQTSFGVGFGDTSNQNTQTNQDGITTTGNSSGNYNSNTNTNSSNNNSTNNTNISNNNTNDNQSVQAQGSETNSSSTDTSSGDTSSGDTSSDDTSSGDSTSDTSSDNDAISDDDKKNKQQTQLMIGGGVLCISISCCICGIILLLFGIIMMKK